MSVLTPTILDISLHELIISNFKLEMSIIDSKHHTYPSKVYEA